MSTTRRTLLSGALAAPFLARFAGSASGETAVTTLGSVSGQWTELRWTPQAKAQMDRLGVTIKPIAPATWVTDDSGRRTGVRVPGGSGTGDASVGNWQSAHGRGRADGGLVLQTATGRFEITELEGALADGTLSGICKVNGVESGGQSLVRIDPAKGRILADPVPAGQPQTIRVEDVPVYATPQLLEAVVSAVGPLALGTDTVLGHARGEFLYTPPSS